MKKPVINMSTPCMIAVEGSSGKANRSKPVKGIADPELICANIILPAFGQRLDNLSPSQPPNNPPSELATVNSPIKNAVSV